ncbi:hypothetical protein BDY21DRAFT_400213 [Lineolata rhizophorae]|uniref:Uncharacterized protein n=1 Tax=Lineolata rhizophorae TaxID=578093 RepID=A0A6A6NRY8_9PEZI|nr:hypothetical protein BDY21DRAFT_400213 [Lineolata rhizophorae]
MDPGIDLMAVSPRPLLPPLDSRSTAPGPRNTSAEQPATPTRSQSPARRSSPASSSSARRYRNRSSSSSSSSSSIPLPASPLKPLPPNPAPRAPHSPPPPYEALPCRPPAAIPPPSYSGPSSSSSPLSSSSCSYAPDLAATPARDGGGGARRETQGEEVYPEHEHEHENDSFARLWASPRGPPTGPLLPPNLAAAWGAPPPPWPRRSSSLGAGAAAEADVPGNGHRPAGQDAYSDGEDGEGGWAEDLATRRPEQRRRGQETRARDGGPPLFNFAFARRAHEYFRRQHRHHRSPSHPGRHSRSSDPDPAPSSPAPLLSLAELEADAERPAPPLRHARPPPLPPPSLAPALPPQLGPPAPGPGVRPPFSDDHDDHDHDAHAYAYAYARVRTPAGPYGRAYADFVASARGPDVETAAAAVADGEDADADEDEDDDDAEVAAWLRRRARLARRRREGWRGLARFVAGWACVAFWGVLAVYGVEG